MLRTADFGRVLEPPWRIVVSSGIAPGNQSTHEIVYCSPLDFVAANTGLPSRISPVRWILPSASKSAITRRIRTIKVPAAACAASRVASSSSANSFSILASSAQSSASVSRITLAFALSANSPCHHLRFVRKLALDIPLGLVRRPRYVPRFPPPCQSAVAWKYNPC